MEYFIPLTKGYKTAVDEQDVLYLSEWSWYLKETDTNIYAVRRPKINGYRQTIYMHNDILINRMKLKIPEGYECDHEDRNGLNNQRFNLRIVTRSINNYNQGIKRNNTSGVKGVNYDNRDNKWRAFIIINKKYIHLGYFEDFEEACDARLQAEIKYNIF